MDANENNSYSSCCGHCDVLSFVSLHYLYCLEIQFSAAVQNEEDFYGLPLTFWEIFLIHQKRKKFTVITPAVSEPRDSAVHWGNLILETSLKVETLHLQIFPLRPLLESQGSFGIMLDEYLTHFSFYIRPFDHIYAFRLNITWVKCKRVRPLVDLWSMLTWWCRAGMMLTTVTRVICTKYHGRPSKSCQDISLKKKFQHQRWKEKPSGFFFFFLRPGKHKCM